MSQPESVASLRTRIDQLDERIVELLNARARIVVEIGRLKQQANSPIYAPDREKEVLAKVRQANRQTGGPLSDTCVETIYRELMSGSFALEKPLRIAFLGPQGSFSHLASVKKFGSSVEHVPVADIATVFDSVARGHVDMGLAPMENSTIGGIGQTMDAFLEHAQVGVVAEVLVAVHHHLLARCEPAEVRTIYSKPEVLDQCRKWLSATLPEARRSAAESSSQAAELATREKQVAAIGSALAAELYGLKILFANIEDNPHNVTRFLVIGRHPARRSGDDKTSLIFTTAHKSGALVEVLDVFRKYRINLTNIDTRPSQKRNFEYYFFLDLIGHQEDEKVRAALEEARRHCLQLSVLGSFPRATERL